MSTMGPVEITFEETVATLDRLLGLPVLLTHVAGDARVPIAGALGELHLAEEDFFERMFTPELEIDPDEACAFYVHAGQPRDRWPWFIVRPTGFVSLGVVQEPLFSVGWTHGYVGTVVTLDGGRLDIDEAPSGATEGGGR